MLAVQLIPTGALAATYSQELQDAYNWAYSKGVTTMSPIDNANMYGAITRAEMAKMLSVYATEVLGMTPDTTAACTFSDIASVKGDLHDYIIESCQLGIMGQGISAFRPYDTISRAEFGTALSRVLWGSQYEGGTPYYAKHLDALKAAGIMTQISNAESTKEIRGYVMLMLMRSEGNDAVVDCDDPMTVIACTTNTSACPAACREADDKPVVVKAGDLYVTAKAAEGRRAIMPGVSDLDTLTFRTSEDVTINKVVLERYGYSSQDDVDAVWLEDQDGNIIADEKSLSKDKVTLSIKKDYRNVDGTYVATVVARLTGNNLGGTIGFKVVDADSTAKNLNLDDYTPYTYEMVSYTGAKLTVNVKGTDKNYNYEEGESYEVARFQAKAGPAVMYIKGFTLTNHATKALDMGEFLDKLTVKVEGENVSGLKYSVNKDDQLVVSFDEVTVEMNKSALFVISASLADFDDYGDGVAYYLGETTDLNAVEKKTGARVEVAGTALSGGQAKVHAFNGGKIKLANKKLGNIDAAQGSEGVVVAEGTVTVSEPISKLAFNVVSSNTWVSALRMFVNGEEYEAKKDGTTFKFSNVEIAESGKIQFKIDIEDADSVTGTVKLTDNFNRDDFKGAKYDNTREYVKTGDVSGSISFSQVTIQGARSALKNNMSKDYVDFLTETTDTKVVFDGTYTAKKALINLNKFYMSGTKSDKVDSVAYHLYIDDDEVAYTDAYGENAYEMFDDVTVKAGASVKVRVEAEVEANTHTWSIDNVYVVLGGTDEFDKDVQDRAAKVVKMNIKEAGSVTIDAGNARNTVLRTSSTANLATFTVKSSDGDSSTKLDELKIVLTESGANLSENEVELLFDGSEEDGCRYSAGTFTCTSLQLDLPVKVEVNLTVKKSWTYETTLKSLNNKWQTRKFSKKFETVLVKIASQSKVGDETVFTLEIDDGDTNATVTKVQLYTASGAVASLYAAGPVNDGEELRTTNEDKAQYITKITYTYETDEDGTGDVVIMKNPYSDYFKVWNDVAKISAND